RRSAHHKTVLIQRHGAGEDGDDRKRKSEVREPADRPEEFLRVTEGAQLARVVTPLEVGIAADVSHRCDRPASTAPYVEAGSSRICSRFRSQCIFLPSR